jgi:hypothetical protein
LISDASTRYVVSNMGWVDHGSLWCFDVATGMESVVGLSEAKHLSIGAGTGVERFSVVHHFGGGRLLVTAHAFREPERALASVDVRGWRPVASGDAQAWAGLPRAHIGYLNDDATGAAGYFVVRIGGGAATVDRLDWFNNAYDQMYQSVIAVAEVPETGESLFGVQRSSDLVLADAVTGVVVRRVALAGRHGNPVPKLRRTAPELWAVDHDTVVRLDRRSWTVTGAFRGQLPGDHGVRMFLGDLWFASDEQLAVVPRPGSGDVLTLDTSSLEVLDQVETGAQPLEALTTPSGDVIARDWKTGRILIRQRG